jgi:hypothetical protein
MIVARYAPAPDVLSDAQIAEYVKANSITIYHPIGMSNAYTLVFTLTSRK